MRLQPRDPPAPTLALVAAVALHEAIAPDLPGVQIKWPNDLLVGAAKIAGILLERQGDAVIVGCGVNLAHYPQLADRIATSVRAIAGKAPEPDAFLRRLAPAFAGWLKRWRAEGLGPIRLAWLAGAHPPGTLLSTADTQGIFDGLDESGALRLRLPGGGLRVVHAGDVFLL